MDPIVTVLRFGDVERVVGGYGVMLTVALLVASVIATRAAARAGLDVGATIAAIGLTAGAAMLGSWLLYAAVEWARTGSPLAAVEQPGLVFFGAPLGGALALWIACKKLGLPLGRLVDVAVPAIPAAHAMGRLGCFLGGCCYGLPWDGPWAVTYTHPLAPAAHPPVPRHPVPLYESAVLLVLALVFALVPLGEVGRGRRLAAYLACYGGARIVLELFRGDRVRGLLLDGAVSTSQLIGAAVAIAATGYLFAVRRRTVAPRPVAS